MTNKTEHTGLPWDYYIASQCGEDVAIIHPKDELDDYMVCKITDEGGERTSPEANAQFIVTAANYHYRLIEALKDCTSVMCDGSRFISYKDQEAAKIKCEALLAELDTKKA